ncbi:hypothetical protein ABZW18_05455 [Streptomyces sp. NPDC004647]|uniref:hypothetical protein n=1 Tax=Streptomyces sp. NPDC004647 TaxID=3154671 RepID=UPI0033B5C4D9
MQIPVDDTTLTAWASLLGMTSQQTADTITQIEEKLRLGYAFRPDAVRHLSFEELMADMGADEFALMFLETGLRCTGHPDAAASVLARAMSAAGHTTTG